MKLLIEGSVGQDVRNLQTGLNYHMPDVSPPLKVDGIYGPITKRRVSEYQRRRGLKMDGIAGPKTQQALFTFIGFSAHIAVTERREGTAARGLAAGAGGAPASEPVFPPMPRLELPFPQPFRWPPPPPATPRLEIDPRLLALMQVKKYELSAGQQIAIERNLTEKKTEASLSTFTDISAVIWYKGSKHFEVSAGAGIGVEHQLLPAPGLKAGALIFAKAEVKDILKLGPVDILRLQGEAQVKGGSMPTEVSVGVGGGPVVDIELKDKRSITFGPSGWFQWTYNGQTHVVTAPLVKLDLTYSFF